MVVKKLLNFSATADFSRDTTPSIFKPMLLDLCFVFFEEPNCLIVCQSFLGLFLFFEV